MSLLSLSPHASSPLSTTPHLPLRTSFSWISRVSFRLAKPRITCLADDGSKEEAARRALEQAFEPSKRAFKRWDEEIKAREAKIDDGDGGRGRGGDGGGDGPDGEGSWDWEEAREVFLATSALILLYLLIIGGPKGLYAIAAYAVKFVMRGFRHRSPQKKKKKTTKKSVFAERRNKSRRFAQ